MEKYDECSAEIIPHPSLMLLENRQNYIEGNRVFIENFSSKMLYVPCITISLLESLKTSHDEPGLLNLTRAFRTSGFKSADNELLDKGQIKIGDNTYNWKINSLCKVGDIIETPILNLQNIFKRRLLLNLSDELAEYYSEQKRGYCS